MVIPFQLVNIKCGQNMYSHLAMLEYIRGYSKYNILILRDQMPEDTTLAKPRDFQRPRKCLLSSTAISAGSKRDLQGSDRCIWLDREASNNPSRGTPSLLHRQRPFRVHFKDAIAAERYVIATCLNLSQALTLLDSHTKLRRHKQHG
jgi:hypothetical protein